MQFRDRLGDGAPVTVHIPRATIERLWGTCFRGSERALAGNFSRWENATQMFKEPEMREPLLTDILEVVLDSENRLRRAEYTRVTLFHHLEVGWESTAPRHLYAPADLEPFELNDKTWGQRVRLDRVDLLAPRTREVVCAYGLRLSSEGWLVTIYTLYPGQDVGSLRGNVTRREDRVFFDWNHPGA